MYLDPELLQGVPLSNLTGLAGLSNAEQQKNRAVPTRCCIVPACSCARAGTWAARLKTVESDVNQLAGKVDARRLVVTVGNLSVIDLFDGNGFAHDPRSQFMNTALATNGAYDYASDARGYHRGAAAEYFYDDWTLRAGRFRQPLESNGLPLDSGIFKHFGDQIELEHAHTVGGQGGKLRLLAFRNAASMGSFRDALFDAQASGGVPSVARVRKESIKYGFGVGFEQNLTPDIGVFARAGWNDGATEAYAFAEIERALSAGAAFKGTSWGRHDDVLGLALARNGLSAAHRDYLAAGGVGAFIGDGRLNYRPETVLEAYYNIKLVKHVSATVDVQRIANPAYNADRGPVTVGSIRLHAEF
ncbi:carbohydrate porin [Undibacterium arcticum]